jgi:hypothetical protein
MYPDKYQKSHHTSLTLLIHQHRRVAAYLNRCLLSPLCCCCPQYRYSPSPIIILFWWDFESSWSSQNINLLCGGCIVGFFAYCHLFVVVHPLMFRYVPIKTIPSICQHIRYRFSSPISDDSCRIVVVSSFCSFESWISCLRDAWSKRWSVVDCCCPFAAVVITLSLDSNTLSGETAARASSEKVWYI